MRRPTWKHDCPRCIFLGSTTSALNTSYDLYACDHGPGLTVVARFGDGDGEYRSGFDAAMFDPVLKEAVRRACLLGVQLTRIAENAIGRKQ
jgi:hypothetical protein